MAARVRADVLAVAAAAALFTLWAQAGWGGPLAVLWMENLALVLVPAAAGLACLQAARRTAGLPWRLLAAAMLLWGFGSLVVAWWSLWVERGIPVADRVAPPVPGLADLGFLGFFPLAIWGLLLLHEPAPRTHPRLRTALDALLITCSVAFVAWAVGVGANLEGLGGSALRPDLCARLGAACDPVGFAFGIANPAGDILLASTAVFLVTFAGRNDRPTALLLGAGLLSIAAADIDFSTRWLRADNSIGNLLDTGWVLGFGVVALAARRAGPPATALEPPGGSFVAFAPYLVVAAAGVAALVHPGIGDPFLLYDSALIVALVLARQGLVLADNRALNRRLRAALRELSEHQQARLQLLNNVAHDIMGPLTPVRLQMRILDDGQGDERHRQGLAVVQRNVEQVVRMTADLKDLANLEAGGLRVDLQPTDAGRLAREAAGTFADEAARKGVRLEADAPDGLHVRADPDRLRQVVYNFIANALRFTPNGRRVQVRAAAAGGAIRIEVRDEGRGLAPDERARLFRPFSQVHDRSAMEASERGTGLGLFICKGIAEQHGGRVGVESAGLGQGSCFWVEVPAPAQRS